MNILDKIVAYKRNELVRCKSNKSLVDLENSPLFKRKTNSLVSSLKNSTTGIIAEFKRKSPSQQAINLEANLEQVTQAYRAAGAAGLSVLTDTRFFGGSSEQLTKARLANPNIPILRKDFIIDSYQIAEAKSLGADVILLIAEVLSKEEIIELATYAKELSLEVLLEMHSDKQLSKISENIDIVGINNRDLATFEVDYNNSIALYHELPKEVLRISESGISNLDTLLRLKKEGFDGFLIGQCFMEKTDPGAACKEMIDAFNKALNQYAN